MTEVRTPSLRDPSLRDPAHRVSSRAQLLWAAAATVPALLLGAGLLVVQVLQGFPVWAWVLYVVVAIGYVAGMPVFRYRVHRWERTETAVYTQSGWLSRERRIAPMSRVQTVDLHQSPLARLLGLASVTVTTASAAGPLRIDGLEEEVAGQLVDDLTALAQAEAGDAT